MSFTLSGEITSANNSPSFRYLPFENFDTNNSILPPPKEICLNGRGRKSVRRKGKLEKVEGGYPQVNGEGKIVLEKRRDKEEKGRRIFPR